MKNLAIVLPIYQKKFKEYEIISLKILRAKLNGKYQLFIITHKDILDKIKKEPLLKDYKIKFFSEKYFTYQGYNNLLKSEEFYKAFKDFEYILIYQTDCLVFKDNLLDFCKKGYDYIGAPWFEKKNGRELSFLGVGNGGLSLRKVESFIDISRQYSRKRVKIKIFLKNFLPSIKVVFHKVFICRDYPKYHLGCRNEDIFWSYVAKQINPNFKIANYKDALSFAFEKYPSHCFKENNNKLPFGCHAWQKHDRKFWEGFINSAQP